MFAPARQDRLDVRSHGSERDALGAAMIKHAMTFAISGIVLGLAAPALFPYLSKMTANPPQRSAPSRSDAQLPQMQTREAVAMAPVRTAIEGFREISIPADPG